MKEIPHFPDLNSLNLIFLFVLILSFISCAPFTQHNSPENLTSHHLASKRSKPQIEFFVMSQCPYAVEAEKAIIPVIKNFKDTVDFKLYFIAEENNGEIQGKTLQPTIEETEEFKEEQINQCQGEAISEGGKFKSLHGKSEIDEDIRQVVMAKYYPDKYFDYLLLRSENYSSDNWEQCAAAAWMDCEFISQIAQSDEGEQLFRQNIKKAKELKVSASPTLFINGKRYRGKITQFGLNRIICKEGPAHEFCKSIPVCGRDADCLAKGKVGICVNPDKSQAICKFSDPVNFKLTVIKPPDECLACSPDELVAMIKDLFPGVEIEELENDSVGAQELINGLDIKRLPAFYFDHNITQAARYSRIQDKLLKTKDGFLLDPRYLTVSYLLNREEKQGDIKLFVESMSPRAIATENFLIEDGFMDEAYIDIHYIAGKVNSQNKKEVKLLTIKRDRDNPGVLHLRPQPEKIIFKSPKGLKEIQEDIRQLCIYKHYPAQHLDYLLCINKNLEENEGTIDWKQCLQGEGIDYKNIAFCTNGKEGMNMLLQDIALIEELGISLCPTYLVNNNILLKGIDPIGFKKIYTELRQETNNGGGP